MRRMWVLIASVLACAIITASPATAEPAAQPVAGVVAATTTSATLAQGASPVAARAPMNWFSDWQTCIWGIGAPIGVARSVPGFGKAWVLANKARVLNRYNSHVRNACLRFIYS